MKKIYIFIIISLVLFCLCGCEYDNSSDPDEKSVQNTIESNIDSRFN